MLVPSQGVKTPEPLLWTWENFVPVSWVALGGRGTDETELPSQHAGLYFEI